MKAIPCLVILALLLPAAFASDLNGTWKVRFTGDAPAAANSAKELYFDLFAHDNSLSGQAYLVDWLGFCDIWSAKLDGDRFSFTVNSIKFTGSVNGKQLTLTAFAPDAYPMSGELVESKVTAPVSINATAEDVNGKWNTWFVCRMGPRPKMFAHVGLDLKIEGNQLTGMAHMGGWPGDATISDGRFEGGHFSFMAKGTLSSTTGIPVFRFDGTIHGKEMKLNLRSVTTVDGNFMGEGAALAMDGKKLE